MFKLFENKILPTNQNFHYVFEISLITSNYFINKINLKELKLWKIFRGFTKRSKIKVGSVILATISVNAAKPTKRNIKRNCKM